MNEKDIEKFKESAMRSERVWKVNYTKLDEFYKMLDRLECANEDKTILVLSRYGIKPSDINLIKWSSINRNDMVIEFNDVKLPIDERILKVIDKLKSDNETILNSRLTIEKIYTRAMIVSRNNSIPRISLQDLVENRAFDLLIEKYNKNNKLIPDDFKEVVDKIYRKKKITVVSSLIKSFENTMNIKVTRVV